MTSEKFCLRWNDFESNISSAFRELREDKDFFDVTIACEEEQLQAHKVILSACSPFFKTVLRRNKHENPFIYLKGVKFSDLVSVLNFMYHGEVNVAQDDLNSFLAVAEDLKVKGLTQTGSGENSKSIRPPASSQSTPAPDPKRLRPPPTTPQSQNRAPAPSHHSFTTPQDDEVQEISPMVKAEPSQAPVYVEPTAAASVDDQSSAMETYVEEGYGEEFGEEEYYGDMVDPNMAGEGNKDLNELVESLVRRDPDGRYGCCECGKTFATRQKCQYHAETHLNISHNCVVCHKVFSTRNSLAAHYTRIHGGVGSPWTMRK